MRKDITIVTILAIVIVVLLVVLLLPKPVQSPVQNNNNQPLADIEIFSPKENEVIFSPLKITGIVRGNGWTGFEGQVGTVKLFDASGKELAIGILTAKGEWMQVKIDFEAELNFTVREDLKGFLVFYNENPSGEPEKDKTFVLPIKFK